MKLNLDKFIEEIHSWKNLIKQKDEEIESLQQQLSFAVKQNETFELTHTSLLDEISELNNAVASLQYSFRKIEVFEEDRRNLLEEKQKLKNSLELMEKLYYEKNKSLTQKLEKIKHANKEETSKLISQIKNEASKQLDVFQKELEAKENDIKELKTQVIKLLEERDQDILKIKIQYEDKIGKLKQQMCKSRAPISSGLHPHDIFRQKYLKLEKDSEENLAKLKEEIETLKQLVESSKSKNRSTFLSSVLLSSGEQSIKTTAEVGIQTENVFTNLARQFMSQSPDDSADFVNQRKVNKTQSIVIPQKRKLFNLNKNYYDK